MSKKRKLPEAEMDRFDLLIKEQHKIDTYQNHLLEQILLCLQGNSALNIEGIIPAQKRMEKVLDDLNVWKGQLSLYIGLLTGKRTWKIGMTVLVLIVGAFLTLKFGVNKVVDYFKMFFIK